MISEKILLTEFGNNYVRLAIACGKLRGYIMQHCEKIEAPISSGEIKNKALMREIIENYLSRNKIRKCKVRIVLHHPDGIIRFMKFPKMREPDLDKAVRAGYSEVFPKCSEPCVYDYRVNQSVSGEMHVVALRLPEAVSREYADFFIGMGLCPISLDTYQNSASVYLEQNQSGNYAAVFESPVSINILRFAGGRLAASRDIRYNGREYAVSEIGKYMRLFPGVSERIFIFTDLKIADEVFLGMESEVYKATVQFMAFYNISDKKHC